jgi:hypothetical protein
MQQCISPQPDTLVCACAIYGLRFLLLLSVTNTFNTTQKLRKQQIIRGRESTCLKLNERV